MKKSFSKIQVKSVFYADEEFQVTKRLDVLPKITTADSG